MKPALLLLLLPAAAAAQDICPPGEEAVAFTLSFPEQGLDDPAAYDGYRTRFFRDAADNTLQVYIKDREGRLVNLWADAANESLGLTARDAAGAPASLEWVGDGACVSSMGERRSVRYRLRSSSPALEIGHFVVGSMRVERDVQYLRRHLAPYGPHFVLPELRGLVDRLGALPEDERRRHLALLDAGTIEDLEARLQPSLRLRTEDGRRVVRIEQPSLDGRNRLVLEIAPVAVDADIRVEEYTVRVTGAPARDLVLEVRITTDAPPLRPLDRSQIFNDRFLAFYDSVRAARDRAVEQGTRWSRDPAVVRYRRLERQVRGLELVSSQDKLLAGLPNYATYFGRDLLVTALLMQPIWAGTMNEHVLGSVLGKLAPDGQVSHEEALGGQAIRERAAQYVALLDRAREREEAGVIGDAQQLIEQSRELLEDMQRVRENYAMVDDEYQLPVLAARYLAAPDVPASRKRDFLLAPARPDAPASRLSLLLRNLSLVADRTAAYVRDPVPANLIAFPEREPGRYHAASWRDSGAGYGNGRYAMDVNAIWAPQALEATGAILESLRSLGFDQEDLHAAAPALGRSALAAYAGDPEALARAVATWEGAEQHFVVRLSAPEARRRIESKLASLPAEEQAYWSEVLERSGVPDLGIEFTALSLDADGEPIGILGTDIATRWFLDDVTEELLEDPSKMPAVMAELRTAFRPYPLGLFVDRLGPLVANDAYATPDVWAGFERDDYHSPRVVWGREVSMMLMGLMRQIDAAHDADGRLRDERLRPYVETLEAGLRRTLDTVEASGLGHNELWSYRIEDRRLRPVRWGASTDIQLWNLTRLAIEMLLAERGLR